MVGGALVRASALRVGLGVGRALIASGSRTRPSHSCDGWVCDLGVVGDLSIFGLTRRTVTFAGGLLTFALVSGFQLAEHNRGQCHFRSAAFSSQLEAMVGGALARASVLRVGLVVGRALIASGSRTRPSHSCDGWVGALGVVGAPLIFGLTRGIGTCVGGLLIFV